MDALVLRGELYDHLWVGNRVKVIGFSKFSRRFWRPINCVKKTRRRMFAEKTEVAYNCVGEEGNCRGWLTEVLNWCMMWLWCLWFCRVVMNAKIFQKAKEKRMRLEQWSKKITEGCYDSYIRKERKDHRQGCREKGKKSISM